MKRLLFWTIRIALFLSLSTALLGQETTASINGAVFDASGAVVSGALITARNVDTGFVREVTTGPSGDYTLTLLPVGKYELSATKAGFAKYVRTGITLHVTQAATIQITLAVGQVTQEVQVSEQASLVNTSDATAGATVDERTILELPLNGRNYTQLGLLQPGVVPLNNVLGGRNTYSVHGMRSGSNRYLIDGADNFEAERGQFALLPPPDALQEFRILTSTWSSEFGESSGSIVNVLSKSGTNKLHGVAYEFLRNDVLDAQGYFAKIKEALKRNQFGVTLGGPIRKDRTFFFVYYDAYRVRQGVTTTGLVPTALEKAGNFSQSAIKPKDPLTGQRFPGDTIPSNRIDPVAANILALYPLPNGTGNSFVSSPAAMADEDQFGIKIDHRFNEANLLSARYLFMDDRGNSPFNRYTSVPGFPTGNAQRAQSLLVHWTHTFSPQLVTQLRVNYLRNMVAQLIPLATGSRDKLGFQFPSNDGTDTMPAIVLTNFSGMGPDDQGPYLKGNNTYSLNYDANYIRNKHLIKFGFAYQRIGANINLPVNLTGDFNFLGTFTGNSVADLLLGKPYYLQQGGGDRDRELSGNYYAGFFQDEYKVLSNLTLNLGLRYEIFTAFKDSKKRMVKLVPGAQSTVYPDAPTNFLWPGDKGIPDGIVGNDYTNFGPNVGFAWDPFKNGNTSIRGGFGMAYDPVTINSVLQQLLAPPFMRLAVTIFPGFANPYSGAGGSPFAAGAPRFAGTLIWNTFVDGVTPYSMHWNLGIQQRFAGNYLFQVGYVGTRGIHLQWSFPANPAIYIPGQSTVANTNSRRLYPNVNGSVYTTRRNASSNYHGLEASLQRQFSHGLTFQASYTYSHAIDDRSIDNGGAGDTSQPAYWDKLYLERGRSLFDLRHVFALNFTYDAPKLQQWPRPLRAVLGGWQPNGIAYLRTGFPFTVTESTDIALNGNTPQRPNLICDPSVMNSGPHTLQQWFTTSCFKRLDPVANAGQAGTAGRNIVNAPPQVAFDFSMAKNIPISDRFRVQFRTEFFNVLNHPSFRNPVNSITSPSFGKILSANDPRIIQFGLKLYW